MTLVLVASWIGKWAEEGVKGCEGVAGGREADVCVGEGAGGIGSLE